MSSREHQPLVGELHLIDRFEEMDLLRDAVDKGVRGESHELKIL